jgi:hypothetical protein
MRHCLRRAENKSPRGQRKRELILIKKKMIEANRRKCEKAQGRKFLN